MKRILIVEDSQTMRLFIRMFLKAIPEVSITEAGDGIEALEKLGTEKFSLVITDLHMPRMNGLELIEKLRSSGYDMPIIVLTTAGEEGAMEKCLSTGANNYVTKPIVGPVLAGLVMNYVGKNLCACPTESSIS